MRNTTLRAERTKNFIDDEFFNTFANYFAYLGLLCVFIRKFWSYSFIRNNLISSIYILPTEYSVFFVVVGHEITKEIKFDKVSLFGLFLRKKIGQNRAGSDTMNSAYSE